MRKLFTVLAILFTVIGIVFVFLPLGTLGLLPVGLAIVFGLLAFRLSDSVQKKIVKICLIFAALSLAAIIGKEIFVKDEVVSDKQFEQTKIQSEKEAQKELEELEGLE